MPGAIEPRYPSPCDRAMQPLIIAGMHRSGTSVLASVLNELGLFTGARLEENHEATFFLSLNNWLLRQAGAAWDHPEPFEAFLRYSDLVDARAAQLARILTTPRAAEYLGVARYLRHRDVAKLNVPWGWKDPRNTYTIPVWLKLFPEAKLLVIHRHGADVASSLTIRAQRLRRELAASPLTMGGWHLRLPVSNNSFSRCLDIEESMRLWERYCATADRHAEALGTRALILKYEEFLASPARELRRVVAFAGLASSDEAIERAEQKLIPEKAFKYRESSAMVSFAERHRPRLEAFGY